MYSSNINERRKTWIFYSIALLLFGFLSVFYFRTTFKSQFFVDEYHFIKKSIFLEHPTETDNYSYPLPGLKDEILQPKLGPYIYGLAFKLAGVSDISSHLVDSGFISPGQNQNSGWWTEMWGTPLVEFPEDMQKVKIIIQNSRTVSMVFMLGAIFLVFLSLKLTSGRYTALIGSFLVGVNVLVVLMSTLSTTDSFLLCFSYAVFYLTLHLNKIENWRKLQSTIVLTLALSLFVALSMSVKVSGFLYLFYACIYFLFRIALNTKFRLIILMHSLLMFFVSIAIFVALHPYLYTDTFTKLPHVLTDRYYGISAGQSDYPFTILNGPWESVSSLFRETLMPGGKYINFKATTLPFDLIFFAVGIFALTQIVLKQKYNEKKNIITTIIWVVLVLIGTLFYLKTNWQRYYLQPVIVVTMVQSMGIYYIGRHYVASVKKLFFKNIAF